MSPFQRKLLRYLGWAAIAVGALWLGSYGFFQLRSQVVGSRLIRQERQAIQHSSPIPSPPPTKTPTANPTFQVQAKLAGLLEIPTLHLTAPVVEGVGNHAIDVAVGHLTTSVPPGANGTSILAAHNATWFRHVDQLKSNDRIRYVTPSNTYVFSVTGHRVVRTGTPVYNSSDPTLVLESCYPLNALYFTPFRYLVQARLISVAPGGHLTGAIPNQVFRFARPRGLSPRDDTLQTNYVPMGVLTETGSPAATWLESNNPLDASTQATDLYIAVVRAATGRHPTWWHELAPNLPLAVVRPLWGAHIAHYYHNLDIRLDVTGRTVTSIRAKTVVGMSGGQDPGTYAVTAQISVHNGFLRLTAWTMKPEGR